MIKRRITLLRRELQRVAKERVVQRRRRQGFPSVALVGYTNAGKSALFEQLTRETTVVENRLFATLDPLVRRAALEGGLVVAVADTVGFIRKLPHQLVASFRATLLEAASADLLVHVVDVAHPRWQEHLRVGEEVLESLGVDPSSCLVALNKVDLLAEEWPDLPDGRHSVFVSARTGYGLSALRQAMTDELVKRGVVDVLRVSLQAPAELSQALERRDLVGRRFSGEGVELYLRRR